MSEPWVDVALLTNNNHHPRPDEAPHPTYSVRILHRDRSEDWHWHPYAMESVRTFCEQHEHQADPDTLIKNIQQAFVHDDPHMIVLAFFMGEELIGHMLCDRNVLYYRPIVTVHQYLLDHGVPPAIRHEHIRLVKEWARYCGPKNDREPAQFIQWLTNDKRVVKMHQRYSGAKPHMLLMRTPVEEE